MGREAREKEIRARIDADAQSLQKQLQDAMSQAIMLQQKVAMAEAKRASDAAAEDLARKDWEAKATESVRIERSRSRSRSGSPIQTAISLMDDRGTRDLSSAKMGAQMALESLPRRSGGSINGVNVEQRMMRAELKAELSPEFPKSFLHQVDEPESELVAMLRAELKVAREEARDASSKVDTLEKKVEELSESFASSGGLPHTSIKSPGLPHTSIKSPLGSQSPLEDSHKAAVERNHNTKEDRDMSTVLREVEGKSKEDAVSDLKARMAQKNAVSPQESASQAVGGPLNREEIGAGIQRGGHVSPLGGVTPKEAADKLFERLDMNGDGVIDGMEWNQIEQMLELDRVNIEKLNEGPAKKRAFATLEMQLTFVKLYMEASKEGPPTSFKKV